MNFQLEYHELVVKKDIPALPRNTKNRIKSTIEEKLQKDPTLFAKPLRKSLKNYRSLRIGQYRIIFRIQKSTIKIFIIQHRSKVYQEALKRL